MSNAVELAAELSVIATKMRELGVVRLKTPDVEVELGALAALPPKGRELSDDDYMFAATEGIVQEEDAG